MKLSFRKGNRINISDETFRKKEKIIENAIGHKLLIKITKKLSINRDILSLEADGAGHKSRQRYFKMD